MSVKGNLEVDKEESSFDSQLSSQSKLASLYEDWIHRYIEDIASKTNAEIEYLAARYLKEFNLRPDQVQICTKYEAGKTTIWIERRDKE